MSNEQAKSEALKEFEKSTTNVNSIVEGHYDRKEKYDFKGVRNILDNYKRTYAGLSLEEAKEKKAVFEGAHNSLTHVIMELEGKN